MDQESNFVCAGPDGSQAGGNTGAAAGGFGLCDFQPVRLGGLYLERSSGYRGRSPSPDASPAPICSGRPAFACRFGRVPHIVCRQRAVGIDLALGIRCGAWSVRHTDDELFPPP